jgi:alpha-D-ribose 1-methylphosphonate 5-triphosphate diphosphatase
MALVELDKKLASCGITTMFHSLSFSATDKNEMRRSDVAKSIVMDIHALSSQLSIRNLIHARFEMIDVECTSLMASLIRENRVHLFSIMDHTPGQGQFVSMDHFKAYYGTVDHMTEEELERLAERRLEARRSLNMSHVERLAALCREHGVPMASHDDDSTEKVRWVHGLGIGLSEFPVNEEAAESAHRLGMHVLMGAPNILRGGSLTGNLSGREAVRKGWCDVIASDYSPATMLHALFELARLGVAPLHELVKTVSLNPARAVGLADEFGTIQEGLSADLLLVDTAGGVPRIRTTFVKGRPVFSTVPMGGAYVAC